MELLEFKALIWDYYSRNKRTFAWRETYNPYAIFISEVMLQQTQTTRVIQKYAEFIAVLDSFEKLASVDTSTLLKLWQGLGYNRRALALRAAAQMVQEKFMGKLPDEPLLLDQLPGIGPATAASITAFAFNKPTVFIETNIRSVFIHLFFSQQTEVPDKLIVPLVAATVDQTNPREWYYALMDYGVMLKKTVPNPSRKSKHHTVQSKFEGSRRQIRGAILRLLLKKTTATFEEIKAEFHNSPHDIKIILEEMIQQGFICKTDAGLQLC